MGRVARYKKTKSFDKLHSGEEYVWGAAETCSKSKKRSQIAERHRKKKMKRKNYLDDTGFDIPSGKDDFDLSDLNVKKEHLNKADGSITNNTSSVKGPVLLDLNPTTKFNTHKIKLGKNTISCVIPQNDREEKAMLKALNIDTTTGCSKRLHERRIEGKKVNESLTAFKKRLKMEAKNALATDYRNGLTNNNNWNSSPEIMSKSDRRKQYLKNKKKKKKAKIHEVISSSVEDMAEEESFITGEQAAAQISFLDRVEEPPVFELLPRGAQNKSKLKLRGLDDRIKSDKTEVMAHEKDIQAIRSKVQAQYAILKAKRIKHHGQLDK